MRAPVKTVLEVAAVIGIYVFFFAVGLYSGHTTMNVDIANSPQGMELRSSPVELASRVTIRGVPVSDVRVRFTVQQWGVGEVNLDLATDADGTASLLFPASTGNYSWHVTAFREGYPTIISRSNDFSMNLTFVVDTVSPSHSILAVSPVGFRARVTDASRHPVPSANVTFYVDSAEIGSSMTGANGFAAFSAPLTSGTHEWFASASKSGEGGISDTARFVVAQASTETGFEYARSPTRKASGKSIQGDTLLGKQEMMKTIFAWRRAPETASFRFLNRHAGWRTISCATAPPPIASWESFFSTDREDCDANHLTI